MKQQKRTFITGLTLLFIGTVFFVPAQPYLFAGLSDFKQDFEKKKDADDEKKEEKKRKQPQPSRLTNR
jgi:hypothetical protein